MKTTCEVRVLPIGSLKPAAYNPRVRLKATDPAYRKLKASLREFGLVEPLIWNETTGRVVGGHARLRILRNLGVKEVAVSVVQLTEAREKALNIVLNNQEAQGRYDTGKLAKLLEQLEDLPEFDATGFDHRTLSKLQIQPDEDAEAEDKSTGMVSVTLEMDGATYEDVAPQLEAVVGTHDLVSHVRHH